MLHSGQNRVDHYNNHSEKNSEVFGKIITGSLSYLIYIHNSHIFTIVYEDALKQEASKHASNSF